MKVTFIGPADATRIVATGQLVFHGDSVEVDDDLGRSLCEQESNWVAAKSAPVKPAAAKKAAEPKAAAVADTKEKP